MFKILRVRNLAWEFFFFFFGGGGGGGGVMFVPGNFLGFVGGPRKFLGVLIFAPFDHPGH